MGAAKVSSALLLIVLFAAQRSSFAQAEPDWVWQNPLGIDPAAALLNYYFYRYLRPTYLALRVGGSVVDQLHTRGFVPYFGIVSAWRLNDTIAIGMFSDISVLSQEGGAVGGFGPVVLMRFRELSHWTFEARAGVDFVQFPNPLLALGASYEFRISRSITLGPAIGARYYLSRELPAVSGPLVVHLGAEVGLSL